MVSAHSFTGGLVFLPVMARFIPSRSNFPKNAAVDINHHGFAVPLLWCCAAVALGIAVQVNLGFYYPSALLWLGIGGILMLVASRVPFPILAGRQGANLLMGLLFAGWLWQFLILTGQPLAAFKTPVSSEMRSVMALTLVLAGVLVLMGFVPLVQKRSHLDRARFMGVLVLYFALSILVVKASPAPKIDVWDLQQLSCQALIQGTNPYGITIPDTYDGAVNYGPEIQKNGQILFGYCYPPLSLLLTLPGYLLFGDHRYSQVAALAIAAALMGFARPGRLSFAATSLFLFTPRMFYVIEQAWTEPFVILALAGVVFVACRKPKLLPWMLGLLLATKQYMIFALPLFGILAHNAPKTEGKNQSLQRCSLLPLGICFLLSLPFVLWDVQAFYHSVFWIYTKFPPADQSLSFLTWLRRHQFPASESLSFVLAGLAVVWMFWELSRLRINFKAEKMKQLAPSYFAASSAFVLFVFFAWSKRSFCNHYFLVIAALCAAIAVWPFESGKQSAGSAD